MTLARGVHLGPYEITELIGIGGMGEVYRAFDTSLKRAVAIKVLPASVATDPERVARFQREAEVLASLNHPNIAHIHGLEKAGDTVALVMELVEGPTLADLIERASGSRLSAAGSQRDGVPDAKPRAQSSEPATGGLPLADALSIARQIADALEAAHEHGIVHRDLKPANVKVRPDGVVKILDFGLAKAVDGVGRAGWAGQASGAAGDVSQSPTLTSPALMTGMGVILGTAAYMAPEQARGKAVDKRTDVWAFGAMLYEMLAGKRAFEGDDATDVIAAVVKSSPDWSSLPTDVPASVRRLLRRCLDKDPNRRLSAIGDARLELDDATSEASDDATTPALTVGTPTKPQRTAVLVISSVVVGGLVAAVGIWFLARRATVPPPVERYVITTPADAPLAAGGNLNLPSVAMSPDGSRIAFRAGAALPTLLWIRERGRTEPTMVPGTEGGAAAFFSPDGKWLGFFAGDALKRAPLLGGPIETICKVDGLPLGASWGPDDQIVFATSSSRGLRRVAVSGGDQQALTRVETGDPRTHAWPEVLPDGSGVLFVTWNGAAERSRIEVVSLADGHISTLLTGGTSPRYARSGHLVFAVGSTLRAVRLDTRRRSIAGEVVTMLTDIGTTNAGGANYAVGADGALVYTTPSPPSTNLRTLVWVDRRGREEAIKIPPRGYAYARLSPDGSRVALDSRDGQNDVWILDVKREILQRLTTDAGLDRGPIWTPDGTRVAFSSARNGLEGIYWQRADGSAMAERLDDGSRDVGTNSFSADGKRLVFQTPTSRPYDIGVLDVDTRHEELLIKSSFSEANGAVSPDGRWLAYQSDESGRDEIYVSPFPGVATARHIVSSGGGTRPLWSSDGRELFYYVEPGTIMALPVVSGSDPFGKPTVVVKGSFATPPYSGRHYDVSRDGKRFLLMKDVEVPAGTKPAAPEIRIVLHFFDELNRLVGKN